jgi:hypothetical protein
MISSLFTLVLLASAEDVEDMTECPEKTGLDVGASCGDKGGLAGTNCYRRRSAVGNPKWGDFPPDLPNQDDVCPRLPNGYACGYSFQCSTKFCCPYQKICLPETSPGSGVGGSIASDLVVYPAGYTYPGDAVCKPVAASEKCLEGTFWFAGDTQVPDYVPHTTYDVGECDCDPKFVEMLNAGTWVVEPGEAAETTPAADSGETAKQDMSGGGAVLLGLAISLLGERFS